MSADTSSGREFPLVTIPPPGPRSIALAERLRAVESPAFEARRATRERASGQDQAPIAYARGHGANVWDADDNRYVDLVAGFGALSLGHAPKGILSAVAEQSNALVLALGDVYSTEIKAQLCERLAALLPEPGARVMLGLSGADAVTAALKTAVLASGRPGVIAFEGSYHGLSYAPLAACGLSPSFREPFAAQLGDHVRFAPYPSNEASLAASLRVVDEALAVGDVGAILVEPILGRGGCVVPPSSLLGELRARCDRAGALLVADEIWTGMGRSGHMLHSVDNGVLADLVCVGKALGAGWPISACIGRGSVMEAWGAHGGTAIHTATHFGWPAACAAAIATLDALAAERLPERAHVEGARWLAALESLGLQARGEGLMIGVDLGDGGRALRIARLLLSRGWIVLTGGTRGEALTLTPALDIAPELLDAFARELASVLGST